MKVGYVRVSTAEQNTARQEILMKQLGFILTRFLASLRIVRSFGKC